MSGALPLAAIPPQAIPSEPDSLLTLRAAPKTHVTVRGLSKSFVGKPLYTNFNLDLPRSKIVSDLRPQWLRQVDADEHHCRLGAAGCGRDPCSTASR